MGRRNANETLQLGVLAPKIAVLDEIDSGLDVDALRAVSRRIEASTNEQGLGVLAITHYNRLLHELRPDRIHVLVKGRIQASGGPELAEELERTGYAAFSTVTAMAHPSLSRPIRRTRLPIPSPTPSDVSSGMRSTRYLAMAIGVVLCSAVASLLWPRTTDKVAAAATTTTTTRPIVTTTTTAPVHAFEAADAVVREVALYDSPGAAESTGSLPNPTTEHVPLAFLVKAHGPPGWLQVQVARRPNGSTAWIHESDVALRTVDNRIKVEVEARRLTVYRERPTRCSSRRPSPRAHPRRRRRSATSSSTSSCA